MNVPGPRPRARRRTGCRHIGAGDGHATSLLGAKGARRQSAGTTTTRSPRQDRMPTMCFGEGRTGDGAHPIWLTTGCLRPIFQAATGRRRVTERRVVKREFRATALVGDSNSLSDRSDATQAARCSCICSGVLDGQLKRRRTRKRKAKLILEDSSPYP